MDARAEERLKGLRRFGSKEEALQEAVRRAKADEDLNEMVMSQEDGKFLLVGWQDWEIAMTLGRCKPVYGGCYIYDMAAGRNPSDQDNLDELMRITGGEIPGKIKKAMSYDQVRGMN